MVDPVRSKGIRPLTDIPKKAITKRAGRKKDDAPKAQRAADAAAGGNKPQVKKAVFESTKKKEVGVSDLTLISKISNDAINDNLKKRFENGEIYTYIGHVLVSVNPFRDLGIYTDEVLASYRGKNRLEVPPHVFAVAESAYYNMKGYNENQCVIISGESGAGKTEAAKRIMQYIANVSEGTDSSIQQIKDMVLATNPLLESFGNAKTLRNNNSSRFGKYLELQFNARGEPVGANITNYLLEKSRVVGQIKNERNFHIFYQFTKAASQKYRGRSGLHSIYNPQELTTMVADSFGVQEPQQYLYTSKSGCQNVEGINDTAEFEATLHAMRVIGLPDIEQDDIFRLLAAILWIGNVQFKEDGRGNATITDSQVVDFIAYLLEVDAGQVSRALTVRVVETSRGGRRGSVYDVPLNGTQANAVRDALAKAIYNNLFDWIVERVNASLRARGAPEHSIGILDIYGFEIFERNSFEQLCINYVNEKLQQIFIQLTLKTEQEEYAREQIKWTPINYFDNKVVCELIEERRPPGVLAALNDACATAHADPGAADQAFVQRLSALSSHPHFQPRQGQFIVKHYAGDVAYAVEGMTDKNKDQLLKDLLNLVGASSNLFLRNLFPEKVDQDSKRRPPTAGDKIKASANNLVATLMKASPSYIRTIKPNDNKSPSEYNVTNVMHQIKYLGLQENVRIRRAGFAYRQTFEKFVERFYLLSPKTSYAGNYTWTGDATSATRQILKDTGIPADEYQMGVSKAFIKTPETLFALEHMRDRYWHNMAVRIQRAWRNYLRYRIECAIRIQRWWRRFKGGLEYINLRDYGHKVLQRKKERRRFSVLGSRRFLGDYLAVGSNQGMGELLRSAIGGSDKVLFSCRCELLVAKFGRSSKPGPRVLVLTTRTVYIIVQAMVNQQLSVSTERSIPLNAISYVSTSVFRDDWFAIGVGSAQESDPLISCLLKTEFFTHLSQAMRGGLNLRIAPTIEYDKKPGKPAVVKVSREPNAGQEAIYKSGVIHTAPGELPDCVSLPTPRGKEGISKPINAGKLLRPGGPGGHPSSKTTTAGKRRSPPTNGPRASAAPQPLPVSQLVQQPAAPKVARMVPQANNAAPAGVSRPLSQTVQQPLSPLAARVIAQMNNTAPAQSRAYSPMPAQVASTAAAETSRSRPGSATSVRAPPPAPPPHPAASREPRYRALYEFQGQTENELNLKKDDLVVILQKENNGWWLAKRPESTAQGWTPSAYLQEETASRGAPPPPPSSAAARPSSTSSSVRAASLSTGAGDRASFRSSTGSGVGSSSGGGTTATRAKPAPPAPPAKRPTGRGARQPPAQPPEPRDSGVSGVNGGSGSAVNGTNGTIGGSGRNTPNSSANASLAGGLAEALRARQSAMQGKKDTADDDDW